MVNHHETTYHLGNIVHFLQPLHKQIYSYLSYRSTWGCTLGDSNFPMKRGWWVVNLMWSWFRPRGFWTRYIIYIYISFTYIYIYVHHIHIYIYCIYDICISMLKRCQKLECDFLDGFGHVGEI